jgi:lipopolysaccharide transport system ATP-binding protein
MPSAIQVENLSKQYTIGLRRDGNYSTLREALVDAVAAPWRRLWRQWAPEVESSHTTFWALRDVSFEIEPGAVVGIIGRNGAGKSTLLKILSHITEPTSGRIALRGRVGSLLEVGTGFHSELTGRENIFLNGAILGMSRREIARKFDEIVAFSEIDEFLDTPVKRYSSGMYVRLAFSVAAHLEPEILIVDEVLAVGDAGFQEKCLGKMGAVARSGRTVLLVSHNLAATQHLCDSVVVLSRGRVDYVGAAEEGIRHYLNDSTISSGGEVDLTSHPARCPGGLPILRGIRFLDESGIVKDRFHSGEPMRIELAIDPVMPLEDPQFGIGIDDWMGTRVYCLATYLSSCRLPPLRSAAKVVCQVDELALPPGRYYVTLSAGTSHYLQADQLEHAVSFEVEPNNFFGNGRMVHAGYGKVLVRSHWEQEETVHAQN